MKKDEVRSIIMNEISSSIEGFDEELYRLEEEYLKRFGVYPALQELDSQSIPVNKEKLKECIESGEIYLSE